MKLEDLAHLVLVRNHLSLLINTERKVVTKDQFRTASVLQNNIDRLFMDYVSKLNLEKLDSPQPFVVDEPGKKPVKTAKPTVSVDKNNTVVVSSPEDLEELKQLSFDFTTKKTSKKTSAKKARTKTAEDKEIAKRIAQAKKEVAAKKKTSASRATEK